MLFESYADNAILDQHSGAALTQHENDTISIQGLAHIGIRVHDLDRAVLFYALLGFTKTAAPFGPEPVLKRWRTRPCIKSSAAR